MPLPDNRIRLPAGKIDLATDVGETGQDHDNYPAPASQARADWMNLYLIGLLANQSSYTEPTQYRGGTPWFDLNDSTLKIRSNNEWKHFSDVISVQQTAGLSTLNLTSFATQVLAAIPNIIPEVVYSGVCTNDNVTSIPIPESLRSGIDTESRPFVYINGLLIDPRNTRLEPGANPSTVVLVSDNLDTGDLFTVNIRYIPDATFYSQSVAASNSISIYTDGNWVGGLTNIATDVLVATGNGINFDTSDGSDGDIDILTLNVTGDPKLWWDESVDAFALSKPLWLGGVQATQSGDPYVNVNRNVDDTGVGAGVNGHCFSDSSTITRGVGGGAGIAYNSYDARFVVSGTADYDHLACFQNGVYYNSSGTLGILYGLVDVPTVAAGTVTNRYGVHVSDASGAGTVTNNIGINIATLTKGTTLNYAIRTVGATMCYFGGHIGVGTVPESLRPISIAGAHAEVSLYGITNSTSNTANIVGFNSLVSTAGSAAISVHMDLYAQGIHGSTGVLVNRYNVYCAAVGNAGCNTTNRSGIYVSDQTGSGALTNQYGLRVAALSKGSTLNYAIYTEGATPSLFEGPLHLKNVAGPAALTDGAVIYATDQSPGNACIHAKTEGGAVIKLYQQAHIADAAGGTEVATINSILSALRNNGLLAAA